MTDLHSNLHQFYTDMKYDVYSSCSYQTSRALINGASSLNARGSHGSETTGVRCAGTVFWIIVQ